MNLRKKRVGHALHDELDLHAADRHSTPQNDIATNAGKSNTPFLPRKTIERVMQSMTYGSENNRTRHAEHDLRHFMNLHKKH